MLYSNVKVSKAAPIVESDAIEIIYALNEPSTNLSKTKNVVEATIELVLRVGVFSYVNCSRFYNFVVHSLARTIFYCFGALSSSSV